MLDSHLVATPAVVDCTSGIVPVHIVNVHEEDRTLFKNVTLDTLETVKLASADESPGGRPSVNSTTFLPGTLTTEQQEFLALFRLDQLALNDDERFRLSSVLLSYRSIFACSPDELSHTKVTTHQIPIGDSQPIRDPAYRTLHHLKSVLKDQIDSMLDNGIISPSTRPWSSPVVLVRKNMVAIAFVLTFVSLMQLLRRVVFHYPESMTRLTAWGELSISQPSIWPAGIGKWQWILVISKRQPSPPQMVILSSPVCPLG